MPQVVFHVLIFDEVITLMETFDVVIGYNFLMFFLNFDVVKFVVVTLSHQKALTIDYVEK